MLKYINYKNGHTKIYIPAKTYFLASSVNDSEFNALKSKWHFKSCWSFDSNISWRIKLMWLSESIFMMGIWHLEMFVYGNEFKVHLQVNNLFKIRLVFCGCVLVIKHIPKSTPTNLCTPCKELNEAVENKIKKQLHDKKSFT